MKTIRCFLTLSCVALRAAPLIPAAGPANRVIAPSDLTHSMILKRLKGDGVPRMPMGSVGPFDQAGIDLITEWIKSMPAR